MVANILLFNPKGMAAKGAGATAERSDRHRPHRGKVVATYIGRHVNHYRFALRTSSDMPPSARRILPSHSAPAVLPAERANFDSEAAPSLGYL